MRLRSLSWRGRIGFRRRAWKFEVLPAFMALVAGVLVVFDQFSAIIVFALALLAEVLEFHPEPEAERGKLYSPEE